MKLFLLYALLTFANIERVNICNVFGRIKIVHAHEDFKVFVVDSNPDLEVKIVDNFYNSMGHWKIVHNREDFKVKIVNNKSQADFTIKFVNIFPRCKINVDKQLCEV